MIEKFNIGDYVKFAKNYNSQEYNEIGIITEITDSTDNFWPNMLIIKQCLITDSVYYFYRRFFTNVQKMSKTEIVLFHFEN